MAFNLIALAGKVEKPESKTLPSSLEMFQFTLIQEDANKKQLKMPVVLFGNTIKKLAQLPQEGDQVLISGKMSCNSKEYNGVERFFYSVVANDLTLLSDTVTPSVQTAIKQKEATGGIAFNDELPF